MDIRQASNKNKYNVVSSIYDIVAFILSLGQAKRLYREVAARLRVPTGATVVELGCGPGSVVPSLLHKLDPSSQIIGIDFSDQMIELANTHKSKNGWNNVNFECMDMYQYSPVNKADCVIFCLSLTAIPNYQKAIDKALSILKPDGQLLILDSIPLKGKWYYPLANLYTHFKALIVGAKPAAGITEYIDKKTKIQEKHIMVGGVYTLLDTNI
ncbi:class I SAM-dependent methyltransferase [Desulfosediminicola ganghwensis]|uniref:class I SAM-dependent methyltransferase n=1 Tax=Desulfosediminicola ganghwensis TaxID=2569540 RepID=UPI0010AC98C7|nr:methyltransferase domain-containing protein [Desulfosediminicola ganghwensis]